MLTPYLKKSIAHSVFENQDLGGLSVDEAITAVNNGTEYHDQSDNITAYLVHSIISSETMEDIENDIDYAINQLQRAKNAALNGQLK